jgi:DNA-binding transcriptional regulator YiaG
MWDGEKIKALRTALGMTQNQFAFAVGVSSFVTVCRWERGRQRPRMRAILDRLDALAEGAGQ